MLPGMGGLEFIVIALLALVVVGPKDLPILLRRLGKMTAKVRNMADEFRASFDELARQSELDELRQQVEALRAERFTDPLKADIDASMHEINTAVEPTAYRYDPIAGGDLTPPAQTTPTVTVKKPRKPRAKAGPTVAAAPKPAPARKPRKKTP